MALSFEDKDKDASDYRKSEQPGAPVERHVADSGDRGRGGKPAQTARAQCAHARFSSWQGAVSPGPAAIWRASAAGGARRCFAENIWRGDPQPKPPGGRIPAL